MKGREADQIIQWDFVVKSASVFGSESTCPALPAKLLDDNGKVKIPKADGSHHSITPYGCIAKIPTGGLTILDVELEN